MSGYSDGIDCIEVVSGYCDGIDCIEVVSGDSDYIIDCTMDEHRKKEWMSTNGQKCVHGGSKWRAGTKETEVRQDGWCECGQVQRRNDGGGCATMRERSERVVSSGTYVTE